MKPHVPLPRFTSLVTLGLAACVSVSACSPASVSLRKGPREYVSSDYHQVLKKWTRQGHLLSFDRLDDLLTVTSTYESHDFRWAYVVRYAYDYQLTIEQREKMFAQQQREAGQFHEFFVALYGPKWAWSDLTAENTAWVVRLVDSKGDQTAPSDIIAVRKPGALERIYFPYATDWRRVYRIRFPLRKPDGSPALAPDARWFGLRFAGPQGSEQLRWDIRQN